MNDKMGTRVWRTIPAVLNGAIMHKRFAVVAVVLLLAASTISTSASKNNALLSDDIAGVWLMVTDDWTGTLIIDRSDLGEGESHCGSAKTILTGTYFDNVTLDICANNRGVPGL